MATASSFQTGNEVAKGNDGSLTTRWCAVTSTFPQWWRVDLGASHTLHSVTINWYSSSSRSYKYRIEVSNDDSTYTTVVDKTGNTTTGDTTDTFAATGRYVRVTVTGASAGWASFYECSVYRELTKVEFGAAVRAALTLSASVAQLAARDNVGRQLGGSLRFRRGLGSCFFMRNGRPLSSGWSILRQRNAPFNIFN